MKRNGWVIANAAQVLHVADLVHPHSRMKREQLGCDRPGHVEGNGHDLGSADCLPRTDAREREARRVSGASARAAFTL